jgi:CDP-paratose 2-epimerase
MKNALITGGCGFIGVHACERFLGAGWNVMALDDLSREGAAANLEYLQERDHFSFCKADVSLFGPIQEAIEKFQPDLVVHLAAQVAVTTSVTDPRRDFEINALGTLNLLEALRTSGQKPLVIYSSTNKVYGALADIGVVETQASYQWPDLKAGISESQNIDLYSPYGCSKGAADQYCHDYSRLFSIPTVVLRQSCIYGPRQSGREDQGWVAWFAIAAIRGQDVTVFGNGKQVRDLLNVDDLTRLYLRCSEEPAKVAGKIFNVGGGPSNALSLLDYLEQLDSWGLKLAPKFSEPRPGDQLIFISDNSLLEQTLDWKPEIGWQEGLRSMIDSLYLSTVA